MTKDHARKNRARRTMQATGTSYTTAEASQRTRQESQAAARAYAADHQPPAEPDADSDPGTSLGPWLSDQPRSGLLPGTASLLLGHQHARGTVFTPVDARGFGQARTVSMDAATALLGATIDWCAPCKVRATAAVVDGDPVVIAAVANLMGMSGIVGPRLSPATHQIHPLLMLAGVTLDGTPILDAVTAMNREDRADLLEDAMNVWAAVSKAGPSAGDTDMSPAHDGTGYQITAYTTWHTARRGPLPALFVATSNKLLPGHHLGQCGWKPPIAAVTPIADDHWTVTLDATGAPTDITGLPWPDYPQAPLTLWQRTPDSFPAPATWLQAAAQENTLLLVGPLADADEVTVRAAKSAGTLFVVRAKVTRPTPA